MMGARTLIPADVATLNTATDAAAIAGDATESGPLDPGGGIESRSDGTPQRSAAGRARSRPWRSSPCLVGGPGAAPPPPPPVPEEGD